MAISSKEVSSAKAASAAATELRNPSASKTAKTAAASASPSEREVDPKLLDAGLGNLPDPAAG